jgi:hypothetical protein
MITFRKFLVEKIVGNTGWVYHRTKKNPEDSDIVKYGIKPSSNQSAMYGRGLYCCYDLDEQLKPNMEKYGDFILKGKVDLNGFAILDEDIYRLANPRGDFEIHLRKIGTHSKAVKSQIESENPYTSIIARQIWRECKLKGYNGIIFTGERDGKVAVIWNRRNFIPFSYTEDNGNSWKRLNPDISSIKRKEDSGYDIDDEKIDNIRKTRKKLIEKLKFEKHLDESISLPFYTGETYFLKNLESCSGFIDLSHAPKVILKKLKTCGGINAGSATKIDLGNLESSSYNMILTGTETVDLNKLKECNGNISVSAAKKINLSNLKFLKNGIDCHSAVSLDLKNLETLGGHVFCPSATTIDLRSLKDCYGTVAVHDAKRIIIPKKFLKRLNYIPKDCEIIHPEEQQIKVNEDVTFKKYLMLKEKINLLNEWTREMMPKVYDALEKYDDPMVGVHFSKGVPYDRVNNKKAPHIGITVKPFHNDPIGIYAFPKDYVLGGNLENNPSFREFVDYYIVKPSSRANILNLSTMSEQDAIDILRKMGIGENAYRNQNVYHRSGKMDVGHRFWGTLEVMRKQIYGEHSKNVSWNNLFKKTGYNVLYDEGDGIIHSNEPNQIIYLESSAMEILEQGTQDDPNNKIYSFFIKNFPELRPEKSKDHWGSKLLKLRPEDNSYTLYVYPPSYEKIRIKIESETDYDNRKEIEVYLNDVHEKLIDALKKTISDMNMLPKGKKEAPPVLEGISKRFNIKLKKDERGDWEIRQKYQDADKDYIITFYIRTHNDEIIFVLNKKQKSMNYNSFGYNEAVLIRYRERYSPEEIVDMGLKELEFKRYGSVSVNHDAMKTIGLLRKKVFRL